MEVSEQKEIYIKRFLLKNAKYETDFGSIGFELPKLEGTSSIIFCWLEIKC